MSTGLGYGTYNSSIDYDFSLKGTSFLNLLNNTEIKNYGSLNNRFLQIKNIGPQLSNQYHILVTATEGAHL